MLRIRRSCIFLAACLLLVLFAPTVTRAQPTTAPEPASAPAFVVRGEPLVDNLALKSTAVEVHISGVIADVKVTQRYRSEGVRPLDAQYVFVGLPRAALRRITLRVAERLILPRAFESGRSGAQDRSASAGHGGVALTGPLRPTVFRSAPVTILPGEEVGVVLQYTELMEPAAGKYQFVYPTVLGPRYDASVGSGFGLADRWVAMPFLPARKVSSGSFDLKLTLDSTIPLEEVGSRTHRLEVRYEGAKRAVVGLAAADSKRDNRTFVLDYRLSGDRAGVSAMLRSGQGAHVRLGTRRA